MVGLVAEARNVAPSISDLDVRGAFLGVEKVSALASHVDCWDTVDQVSLVHLPIVIHDGE